MGVKIRYSRMYNVCTGEKSWRFKNYQMGLNNNWKWASPKYPNWYLFPYTISIISCFELFIFREILSLHHTCYYFNRSTPYRWTLDVVFYWPFAIELSTLILTFLVDVITCMQTIWGDHCVFVVTVQKCKCYIFQLVLLRFDQSHKYLYPLLLVHLSSIRNSERYRAIIWNSGTTFRKVSAPYCNYEYYGSIYLINFYLLLTVGFQCLNLFPTHKIRNNIADPPFGIPRVCNELENNLRVKLIVESEIGFLFYFDRYSSG